MALGINEGINDADRAAVRDLLTNIGLGSHWLRKRA
jgi:hypothetical protein